MTWTAEIDFRGNESQRKVETMLKGKVKAVLVDYAMAAEFDAVEDQSEAALAAVLAIAKARAVGAGPWRVVVTGHASPDHAEGHELIQVQVQSGQSLEQHFRDLKEMGVRVAVGD